jgi:hypothetical protein
MIHCTPNYRYSIGVCEFWSQNLGVSGSAAVVFSFCDRSSPLHSVSINVFWPAQCCSNFVRQQSTLAIITSLTPANQCYIASSRVFVLQSKSILSKSLKCFSIVPKVPPAVVWMRVVETLFGCKIQKHPLPSLSNSLERQTLAWFELGLPPIIISS